LVKQEYFMIEYLVVSELMDKKEVERVAERLREIVKPEDVLTYPEDLYCYSRDASWFQAMPDIVVRPHSAEEVARIVKLANLEETPVTPRGAGTNLSGGAVPIRGGIVVDMSGMNRVLEIDKTNLRAIVEPGVVHTDLEEELAKRGLFWPPDPASGDACTMGGVLAECGGGMRALKYGTTRDWVLGLEVVLATGEVIRTGALTLKCATGWDLTRLFVRSEGTLGIITKAILKVRPIPESLLRMFATFDKLETAAAAVGKIFDAGVVPTIMEILDRTTIHVVNDYAKTELPDVEAVMILDVDGTEEECNKLAAKIESIFLGVGAKDVQRATNAKETTDLYRARKSAIAALSRVKPTTLIEDVTVPVSKLPSMIRRIDEISKRYRIFVATFGHAGDGNLHPTLCTDERDPEEWERAMKCYRDICLAAIEMGGTISGEHGIGLCKTPYFEDEVGRETIEVMRRIKRALDPLNILNPGKMNL
jgi:glycolate oxidase